MLFLCFLVIQLRMNQEYNAAKLEYHDIAAPRLRSVGGCHAPGCAVHQGVNYTPVSSGSMPERENSGVYAGIGGGLLRK